MALSSVKLNVFTLRLGKARHKRLACCGLRLPTVQVFGGERSRNQGPSNSTFTGMRRDESITYHRGYRYPRREGYH